MSKNPTAVELLRRSLDTFLAKDMKGWTDLCTEDVVAEFPFAPEGSPRRLEGRAAVYEYLRNYPTTRLDRVAKPHLDAHCADQDRGFAIRLRYRSRAGRAGRRRTAGSSRR